MDLRITLKTLCDGMQKTPLVAAAAPEALCVDCPSWEMFEEEVSVQLGSDFQMSAYRQRVSNNTDLELGKCLSG